MFESLIEQLLLAYLGDYIDNLDKNKLSLGIWSGSLTWENIKLRAKAINDLKLPFVLKLGRIDKLTLCISWKTNFTSPTEIIIEGVDVIVSLIKSKDWEVLDYLSYESKLQQITKYANETYAKLIQTFTCNDKQDGYLNRIMLKILDNWHVVFKGINIRIEEFNSTPNYSLGITLKEMLVINTNENWEPCFIDRTVQKDVSIFKLLKITSFGMYLNVNETNFISKIDDIEEMHKSMKAFFPSDKDKGKADNYWWTPISLSAKMTQLNTEDRTNRKIEPNQPKISWTIEWEKYEMEIQKSQYNCLIFIINNISKYQKYQNDFYEARKFNYFKPKYKILNTKEKEGWIKDENVKNENAVLWLQFEIKMIWKQLRFYKGDKTVFDIPQYKLKKYQAAYSKWFRKYFMNVKKNQNYVLTQPEDLLLFKEIVYSVDIKVLKKWTLAEIESIFKSEKIEEKSYAQSSYLSYYLGYSTKIDESKLFNEEEQKKWNELLQASSSDNLVSPTTTETTNLNQKYISVRFVLNTASFTFIKNNTGGNQSTTSTSEGFNIKTKDIDFIFILNPLNKYYYIESSLRHFHIDMFTKVNKTINHIPITFKSINNDLKLASSTLSTDTTNRSYIDNTIHWNSSSQRSSHISDYFIKIKIESTLNQKLSLHWHITDMNFTYHQVFLQRIIGFFKVNVDEKITNKAWDSFNEIKTTTRNSIKDSIINKNIINIQIDPRKIIIPINKYDIKNSKIWLLEVGPIVMDSSKVDMDIIMNKDKKYKKNYNISLTSLSMSYFYSMKDMKENENRFEILTDISGELGIAFLDHSYSPRLYPSFKMYMEVNNITFHWTEYLYTICVYIWDILKPTMEKDLWSQLTIDKSEIARNSKATAVIFKKNWINTTWENFLAMISGGYVYFFKSSSDDEYSGYFYLKDCTITPKEELLIIKLSNMVGSLELKFSTNQKFAQWVRCLNERIEEMKTTTEYHEEEIGKELKRETVDVWEYFFGGDIIWKTVSFYWYKNNNQDNIAKISSDNLWNLFSISVNCLTINLLLRSLDSKMNLSIQGIKVFDTSTNEIEFMEIINSEDLNDKETKLAMLEIIIASESSPIYNNVQIEIDWNIGYLYVIWNPIIIRKLLSFLAHNDSLRRKVKNENHNPNEKLIEDKFIQPQDETNISRSTCNECRFIYLRLKSKFKKLNIILIQPVLNIMYNELRFGESFWNCDMAVDHFTITGELGNTQLFDISQYPFMIKNQKEFDKGYSKEIFGINHQNNNSTSLISLEYKSYCEWCPHCKDKYASEANVKINSTFLIYVHQQFMRFLNYFMGNSSAR